jgi:hypothetical protein
MKMCTNNNRARWLIGFVLLGGTNGVAALGDNKASAPSPPDGFVIRNTWTQLTFVPGDTAISHDVYFGDNYSDVDAGTGDTFRGNQAEPGLVVGLPGISLVYPGGLIRGTTYYWRIDEFDGQTTHRGNIWSFKVGSRFFVDTDATGANNGSSWADAFNHLQDALTAAQSGDTIWVAEGTYEPDQGDNQTPADRKATFHLKEYVAIYGGFAGNETELSYQDWMAHETILSGDLRGNDEMNYFGDNTYHVVTGSGTDITAVLDGFTITSGRASLPEPSAHGWDGGGMLNVGGSPTVRNCRFINNAAGAGGGMCNMDHSSPEVVNCTFISNLADFIAGVGGGMYNSNSSNPWLLHCTFIGNSQHGPTTGGGGMKNYRSSPSVDYCTFLENQAYQGGAMSNDESDPYIRNCSFISNRADTWGGAMYNGDASVPKISNCVFSRNFANHLGGGIYNVFDGRLEMVSSTFIENTAFAPDTDSGSGGAVHMYDSSAKAINCAFLKNSGKLYGGAVEVYNSDAEFINCTFFGNSGDTGGAVRVCSYVDPAHVTLTNCILWDNTATFGPQIGAQLSAVLSLSFCDLQGGRPAIGLDSSATLEWGNGMIDADPLFGDADGRLSGSSVCIDAGNNVSVPGSISTDLDGNPRFLDDPATADSGAGTPPIVDMGAHEFDPSATGDAPCFEQGCITVFKADFESDEAGFPPAPTAPYRYGPPGAGLETHGAAETFEVVYSSALESNALKITRGDSEPSSVRAIVGDLGSAAYAQEVYYIDFKAHAPKIAEQVYGAMLITIKSTDDEAGLLLRLYNGAYYVAERRPFPRTTLYRRIGGSYDPSTTHHVHIEVDLASETYSLCINGQLLRSKTSLLSGDFRDMHCLEFLTNPMITEAFMTEYIVDDLLITKQPLAAH